MINRKITALTFITKMTTRSLRILHLSDVHFGQTIRNGTNWRLRRVLGKAWEKNLGEIREDGKPDLICFTGDIAYSGQPSEYAEATLFFDELLTRLGVDKSCLFVVPGNHDVARDVNKPEWEKVRDAVSRVNRSTVAQWMAWNGKPDGGVPFGFDATWRDAILARQKAYRNWLSAYGLSHCLPGTPEQAHPHLGYRATVSGWPQPVQIVGLDSAWLAGDDFDVRNLLLTEQQIGAHLCDAKTGVRLPGIAIEIGRASCRERV